MAPLAGAMMLTLLLLLLVSLERRCNTIRGVRTPEVETAAGVELSGAVYRLLTALEFKQELWGLVIVAAGFALLARRVVLRVWTGRCCWCLWRCLSTSIYLTQLPALQGVLGNESSI